MCRMPLAIATSRGQLSSISNIRDTESYHPQCQPLPQANLYKIVSLTTCVCVCGGTIFHFTGIRMSAKVTEWSKRPDNEGERHW